MVSAGKVYKLVPPDGGWGYIIVYGVLVNNVATMGFSASFGLMYNELIVALNMKTQFIATVIAVFCLAGAISGFLTSPLIKVTSKRRIMLLGGVLFNIGGIGFAFANSQLMFITMIAIQSFGSGFIINLSYTLMNDYFLEKKLLFMSLTQAAPSISGMFAPLLIKWLLDEYGYRGMIMILGGLFMQVFVSAALTQPVELHMKRVEVVEKVQEEPLLLTRSREIANLNKKDKSHKVTIVQQVDVPILKKSTSLVNSNVEGNRKGEPSCDDASVELKKDEKSNWKQTLAEIFNVAVLKNFFIVNTCLGLGFNLFSVNNMVSVLPQALYAEGWNEKSVAWAITLYGFGDISLRLLMIVASKWFARVSVRVVYMLGLVIGIISRLGMLWSDSVTMMTIYITVMGISHCTITSLPPVVLAEVTTPEEYSSAIGVSMMIVGIISLVFGPAIGAVRDLTNSYGTTFYMLTSCLAIVLMFWLIEACYRNNQKKILLREKTGRVR